MTASRPKRLVDARTPTVKAGMRGQNLGGIDPDRFGHAPSFDTRPLLSTALVSKKVVRHATNGSKKRGTKSRVLGKP